MNYNFIFTMSVHEFFKVETIEVDAETQALMDKAFALYRDKEPTVLSC